MKTSRRNFFGKIGMAIAAMATGFAVVKAENDGGSHHGTIDLKKAYERHLETMKSMRKRYPYTSDELRKIQAEILKREAGCYQEISGDFENLGFTAGKMAGGGLTT